MRRGKATRLGATVALAMGLALATAAPAAAGGGGCHAPATAAAGLSVVEMKEACFAPAILHVEPGTTVTWTNQDTFPHVVAGHGARWGELDDMARGATTSYRFEKPGIYAYTCYLHPGMNGAVVVGEVEAPPAGKTTESSADGVAFVAPTTPAPAAKIAPAREEAVAAPAASSAPWQAATAVGFALFAVTGGALLAMARSRRPVAGAA